MSGIPKQLRQAVRLRQRAIHELLLLAQCGLSAPLGRVVVLSRRIADLDRYITNRQWLVRAGFDPIAMGM